MNCKNAVGFVLPYDFNDVIASERRDYGHVKIPSSEVAVLAALLYIGRYTDLAGYFVYEA